MTPPGLDLSGAVLAEQAGETGYSMNLVAPNRIVLSRTPAVVGQTPSSYKFSDIINPTYMEHSFSIRLSSHADTTASGPVIDLGSVTSHVTKSIMLQAQVPPILVFCVAAQVSLNCTDDNGVTDI